MNRLHKTTLKILGYDIEQGRECLEQLKENRERRYRLDSPVRGAIYTNEGTLHFATASGFIFDGRSGPKIVDWYAPNLGTFEERLCWYIHDLNGYGRDLSFKDTNVLLYAMLRDLPKYRVPKCNVIQLAVSLSDSWYGEPKDGDWCVCNRGKVETLFCGSSCGET